MPPPWLTLVSWMSLGLAIAAAADILVDVYGRGHRQQMPIMEPVWPVTALYFGPVASWAYRRYGRPDSPQWQKEHGDPPERPGWVPVALGVSHCGAGCTLGDIVGETGVFLAGLTIAGIALWPEFLADFTLALALGIVFQFFAIAPMRGLGIRKGLAAAAKADVLSLVAFEVGLFAWMTVMHFILFPDPHLKPDTATYWFLMQVGMVLGFITAWPANVWLIRRGIKEAM